MSKMYAYFYLFCAVLTNACTAERISITTLKSKVVDTTKIAATELDILMPPAQLDDVLVGVADGTLTPEVSSDDANAGAQKERHNHGQLYNYDAILIVLGAIAGMLMMAFVTHCLWRQHIKRRAAEWEAENARILCQAPYYVDRSQIFVY